MLKIYASPRLPAVSGRFYPADGAGLRAEVRALLAAVPAAAGATPPKALVAPHAAYQYSGAVAARAYGRLAPLRGRVSRVVLLAPAHRVPVLGLALPDCEAFATPMGMVPVDQAAAHALAELPWIGRSAEAHALEHAIEVHLPFLQEVLGEFSLVPLVVGDATPEQVAAVLQRLWGGPETLIVVSSDLSHYLSYEAARRSDRGAVAQMLALEPCLDHHQACGATPVNGLLLEARRRGLVSELLDARNSGDTSGDRTRVVGYASVAFHEASGTPRPAGRPEPAAGEPAPRGETLLSLARGAIGRHLGLAMGAQVDAPFLAETGATFVTLRLGGALRGCMGTLHAHRPLGEDVRHNARSAAFLDPRFPPLRLRDFAAVSVEVSVLGAAEPMVFGHEAEALAQLRPGVDGVILRCGAQQATFLPQVWEELPDPRLFLGHLKLKAGLAPEFWSPELRLLRYCVEKWAEPPA